MQKRRPSFLAGLPFVALAPYIMSLIFSQQPQIWEGPIFPQMVLGEF